MPPKRQVAKKGARFCLLTDAIYNNDTGMGGGAEVAAFYPDAPSFPPLTPVKPRATPYVIEPDRCSINFRTGTVECINNETHGGLYPRPFIAPLPVVQMPVAQPGGPLVAPPPPTSPYAPAYPASAYPGYPGYPAYPAAQRFPMYPNYVYGGMVVNEAPDSPLNRILQRAPAGPWKVVGAAIAHHAEHTAPRDRTMLVYAQMVDSGRDRYNYRVVDPNSVPLDIAEKVHWKNDGDPLHIPGYPGEYRLKLYNNYR
jgi:hypothetical protein